MKVQDSIWCVCVCVLPFGQQIVKIIKYEGRDFWSPKQNNRTARYDRRRYVKMRASSLRCKLLCRKKKKRKIASVIIFFFFFSFFSLCHLAAALGSRRKERARGMCAKYSTWFASSLFCCFFCAQVFLFNFHTSH